ncbi:MAG: LamG domain-containing protein [Roseivirga sp.]|nr:LamG domain-containing protein [Roseivirga sp.]
MAANHISTEKVVGSFFNRASRSADISGKIPSDHQVTKKGRKGRRTADKVKIHNDIEHKGWCFTANDTSFLTEAHLVGPNDDSSFTTITGTTRFLSHMLIYIPSSMIDQGDQKVFGRQNDIGVSIRTTANGLTMRIQGNYRSPYVYDFTDEEYKVDDWNWISIYRDESNNDDETLSSANYTIKAFINNVALNNMTYGSARNTNTGNSAIEWTWFDFSHVDSGTNPANYFSLMTFFADFRQSAFPNITDRVNEVHSSTFSLDNVTNIYDGPDTDFGFYSMGPSGLQTFGTIPDNTESKDILIANDIAGFVDDTIVTPYSIVNKQGYNEYKGTFVDSNKYWRADKITDWNWNQLCGLAGGSDGLTDNFLMEFKVKWPGGLSNSGDRYLFRDESVNYPIRVFKYAENGVGDKLRFFFMGKDTSSGTSDLESVIINGDIEDGYWHHILVHVYRDLTDSGALKEDIYYDGTLDTSNLHETVLGLRYDNSTSTIDIGETWDGYLADLKFYDATKVYSTQEIQDHLAGKPTVKNYCKAHFAFDKRGSTVVDKIQQLPLKLFTGSVSDTDILTEHYGASLVDPGKDVLGNTLQYCGELSPRLQLVNAPCVVLNGTDQSINLPAETQVSGDQDTTFWFKVKIDPNSGDYTVFGSGDLSLFRWSTTDTTIRLRGHTNATESIMTFPHSIRTGEWQDIVLIRRASDSLFTCYVNGVQNTEGYISVSSGTIFRIDSLGEGSTRWTDGEISLFGKWFRSFSLVEIQALSTQLPSMDSVEDLYVFSEGKGSTVYDISGNNNHATIVNGILPDVWGKQNVFHYNFYKGFIKSLKNMTGVEAFFDFTDIDSYTFNSDGSIATITDQVNKYELVNNDPDSVYSNSELALKGNYLAIDQDHFLGNLDQFDIFLRCNFKSSATSGTAFLYLNQGDNNEVWQVGKHPIGSFKRIFYNADSDTPAYDDAQVELASFADFDEYINYNIRHDGSNLFSSTNSNTLTDAGITIKPKDNPLISHLNFGIEGSQKYLIVFNRNVTDDERFFINAFMESGLVPEGALDGLTDKRGYEVTGQYNGASDIQLPDIPEMPGDLRGKAFTQNEVEGLVYAGRVLNSNKDLAVFREKAESIHFQRKDSGLILDDYPATCPSTALQKIHSDFTGNILTVRNEDNLQDASFGFDQYGRLPEADIVEHLNGTANGRVTSYNFQNVDHVGVGYTQTVLAEMPFIAKSGVIQKDSRGLPALRFDGAQSLAYESQTAFKPMHDGTRGVQLIGFQVDEGQSDFWLIGNTDFQGQVGFEFFGDVFNLDKAHFIVRTNTADSAIQDLDIPILMGEYNRMVNYIDPANPDAIERNTVLVNELERAANASTELPDVGNTEDGTTSIGALGVRKMEGYINELIFIGDHKADMLKLSRSLMFMP